MLHMKKLKNNIESYQKNCILIKLELKDEAIQLKFSSIKKLFLTLIY